MAWAYLLRCADDSYYAGSTKDLAVRLFEHQEGRGAAYTRKRLPVELVWSGEFAHITQAYAFERQLHGWSRRKREALIDGRFADLPELSWGYEHGVRGRPVDGR